MKDKSVFFDSSYIPEPNSGCWLWTKGLFQSGYGSLYLNGISVLAHRFAWRLFNGPIPIGMHVLHRCDVRSCVNSDHLFVGTIADNNADMVAKGRDRKRGLRGEDSYKAKFTNADVERIRKRHALGEKQIVLAMEYGVTKTTICDIIHRRSWKHL